MENKDMDLDNIKSNLLALRQLYGLLRNDRDGVLNLNSEGLDHEARLMLKNLLDTTTNDVLKAHSEIIAHQAHVHNLPQPQHPIDMVKQRPLASLDMSKSSVVMEESTLSDRPANDPTQSVHKLSGMIRSVPDQNHDHDVIKQLELHISALQMDAEDLVLVDRHAADHNFKPITNFVPQVELASSIKKIEGAVENDILDSLQLVITQYSQEPKGTSSSLYPGYTIPSIRISNISADQSPPPESISLQQQQIVANIVPAEHRDMSTDIYFIKLSIFNESKSILSSKILHILINIIV